MVQGPAKRLHHVSFTLAPGSLDGVLALAGAGGHAADRAAAGR